MAKLLYSKIAIFLFHSSAWSNIIAFIIVFLVVATLINLIGLFLQKTLKKLALSWLDRVGGVAFGFIRGVLIVIIIAIILVKFPIMGNKLIASSQIVPHLSWLVKILLAFLPHEFSSIVNELIYLS